MSDETQLPEITDGMKCLLNEVGRYLLAPTEKTFFSIEGIIGRYEVPTSKLLWFFMSQQDGHDLGLLFLQAFFSCLPEEDCAGLRFEGVSVEREVRTEDGKFIDLLVLGDDWVLLIENKIQAGICNPFDSYEKYAKRYNKCKIYHAILSPNGKKDEKWPEWKPISYQAYCNALKHYFPKTAFDHPVSKWQVFAREFINHLENELYDPAMKMTPEQRTFVEKNLSDVSDVAELYRCYTKELGSELAERLGKTVPGINPLQFREERGWLVSDSTIDNLWLQLTFQTPAHELLKPKQKYAISVWVKGLTDAQEQRTRESMRSAIPREEGGFWVSGAEFDSRNEAINELCKLTEKLLDLWKNEPPASMRSE